jgi:hypothetical protein
MAVLQVVLELRVVQLKLIVREVQVSEVLYLPTHLKLMYLDGIMVLLVKVYTLHQLGEVTGVQERWEQVLRLEQHQIYHYFQVWVVVGILLVEQILVVEVY